MDNEQITEYLATAQTCLISSLKADDTDNAIAYALRSIAASTLIIAERTVNQEREKPNGK